MLNETHQKVVNTSNDMFDENYYRLTILGKGFIGPLKIPGIFSIIDVKFLDFFLEISICMEFN